MGFFCVCIDIFFYYIYNQIMKELIFTPKSSFVNPNSPLDFHIWKNNPVAMHKHEYYEFLFFQKAPVKHLINGKSIILEPGCLALIRPNDKHSFIFDKNSPTQHVNLAITADYFENTCNAFFDRLFSYLNNSESEIYYQLTKAEISQINYWVNKINLDFIETKQKYSPNITSLFLCCTSIIYNYVKTNQSSFPDWFKNIINTINSQDFIDKSPADIYSLFPMSVPMAIKFFKQYIGETPVEYLTKLKMNYACNLLKHTNYTTLHISSLIGYDSLSHFNHVFKKYKGATPTQYRKQV